MKFSILEMKEVLPRQKAINLMGIIHKYCFDIGTDKVVYIKKYHKISGKKIDFRQTIIAYDVDEVIAYFEKRLALPGRTEKVPSYITTLKTIRSNLELALKESASC